MGICSGERKRKAGERPERGQRGGRGRGRSGGPRPEAGRGELAGSTWRRNADSRLAKTPRPPAGWSVLAGRLEGASRPPTWWLSGLAWGPGRRG